MSRLRDRKRRWAKPFAIMVRDLEAARSLCRVGTTRATLLTGPARPIVLLEARRDGRPAPRPVGGGRATGALGVFLPYTPLHHLLLDEVARPIVLTSGNLTDEPLATDDDDALARLAGLADGFLAHDREIRARYDDSVTRVVGAPRVRGPARSRLCARAAVAAGPDARRRCWPWVPSSSTPSRWPAARAHTSRPTTVTSRTSRRTARSRTASRTCRGCSRWSRRSPSTTCIPSTSRPSTRRAVPAGAPDRRPAPSRARRLVCRGARDHGPVPGRGLRRPRHG